MVGSPGVIEADVLMSPDFGRRIPQFCIIRRVVAKVCSERRASTKQGAGRLFKQGAKQAAGRPSNGARLIM
jgi:hypothetical protein